MRQYLATLHKRSDNHKRRFALLTSGVFTLFIFAIWATVNFGTENTPTLASVNEAIEDANPFGSVSRGLGESFEGIWGAASIAGKNIGDNLRELINGFEVVNFEAGYQELRDDTLNTYGE